MALQARMNGKTYITIYSYLYMYIKLDSIRFHSKGNWNGATGLSVHYPFQLSSWNRSLVETPSALLSLRGGVHVAHCRKRSSMSSPLFSEF